MNERATALHVGEELVPEAHALRGTLDEAGDVGEDELAVVGVERAEDRLQRGERVVGDLRRGPREPGEQRGLACVRLPDEAGVGKQLQPQLDRAGLAVEPALGEPRRLPRCRGEPLVAVAAAATARDDGALTGLDEVEP